MSLKVLMSAIVPYVLAAILLAVTNVASNSGHQNPPARSIRRLGAIYEKNGTALPIFRHNLRNGVKIPASFDARKHWPHCPTVREIRDQGNCLSCWAFAAVEAMSDRICIHSGGKLNFHFSANDLLACCSYCRSSGCAQGGHSWKAWKYWINEGIVSGGGFRSYEGCRPYEIESEPDFYLNETNRAAMPFANTPTCKKECQKQYPIEYEQDLHFGKKSYGLDNDVEQIQIEIMLNGPVQADFLVYENYIKDYHTKGVYKTTVGKLVGAHSVKLIGWGVEKGTPYWLYANSWGPTFGEHGFGKFLRGENFCGIEGSVNAGLPAL